LEGRKFKKGVKGDYCGQDKGAKGDNSGNWENFFNGIYTGCDFKKGKHGVDFPGE